MDAGQEYVASWCTRLLSPSPENREVTGYLWSCVGIFTLGASLVTLTPALAVLAKREAGCFVFECEDGDDCESDKYESGSWYCSADSDVTLCAESDQCQTYGMNPANIIVTMATVAGVLSAVCMPTFGAIVD